MPTKRNNLNKKPSESISLSEKDKSNFENTIKSLVTKKILDNLYTHNLGIWNSKKITKNRLGWTNYHKNILDIIEEGNKFVDALIKEEYKQVVLIGMGGSSQSPKVCSSTWRNPTL